MARRAGTPAADGLRLRAVAAPDAAARMLEERYGRSRPSVHRTFGLAWFQEDAVRRAAAILEQRGGVLIADSVGLGKTYIALALIEEHLGPGRSIAVTAPAALRVTWQQPLRRLNRTRRGRGAWIGWASHALLSRSGPGSSWPGVLDLVVVDEAHAFRNPRTRRYRELARLCRGADVVLLTATPVNNTLLDLYAQLRLFAGNGAFHDLGVPDLRDLFRTAARSGDAPPASLLSLLNAVLIRRTRPLLRDLLGERMELGALGAVRFPERAPPVVLRYDLERTYPGFYGAVTEAIENLSFAAWCGPPSQTRSRAAPAELIRLLLLKRLESSVAAFRASIATQITFLEAFLDHLQTRRWLTPTDNRTLHSGDAAGTQLLLAAVALPEAPPGLDLERVAAAAAADLVSLRDLRARMLRARSEDPKLMRLRELLAGPLAGERVLLFSEFRETARWLWRSLRDSGGVALIDGGGAFLGRARATRRQVINRFAPLSNGAPEPPLRERVRLLIATDVLAEGLNLQDARHVVSFDLPWNPVRLIQRIGRIDRLGSPHAIVQAHAFLPERGLDRLLGLLSRVQSKLNAILATAGAEPSDATFLERIAAGDLTVLDEIERRDAAPFEAEERLRLAWAGIQRRAAGANAERGAPAEPPTPRSTAGVRRDEGESVPVGTIPGSSSAVIVAAVVAGETRFVRLNAAGAVVVDDPLTYQLVARALAASRQPGETANGLSLEWREDVGSLTREDGAAIRNAYAAASALLQQSLGPGAAARVMRDTARPARPGGAGDSLEFSSGRTPAAPGPVCIAAARALLSALGREPGGPQPDLCDRAERALALLRNGVAAGAEQALELILRSGGASGMGADALVRRLDAAISPAARMPAELRRPGGGGFRVVAALVVRPGDRDPSHA